MLPKNVCLTITILRGGDSCLTASTQISPIAVQDHMIRDTTEGFLKALKEGENGKAINNNDFLVMVASMRDGRNHVESWKGRTRKGEILRLLKI